jgi:outer membrane protein assembly factor BamB
MVQERWFSAAFLALLRETRSQNTFLPFDDSIAICSGSLPCYAAQAVLGERIHLLVERERRHGLMRPLDRAQVRCTLRGLLLVFITLTALLLSACGGASSSAAKSTATTLSTATPLPSIPSVYASAGGNTLYALRADTGAVRWKYQATKPPQLMGLGDSAIYIIDPADKLLSAISQADGSLLWKSQAPICDSVPLASDATRVYVPAIQQEGSSFTPVVYAFDAKTGATLWKAQAGPAQQSAERANCARFAVSESILYVSSFTQQPNDGDYSSVISAYKLDTQALLWQHPIPYDSLSQPVVSDGVVYVSGRESVYAFDGVSGKGLWTAGGSFPQGYVAVSGVFVYAGYGGPHYALDRATGQRSTEQPFCALTPDVAYTCDGQQIAALKTAGWSAMWHSQVSEFAWQAIAERDHLYLVSDHQLAALDAQTGKSLWQTPTTLLHFGVIAAYGEIFGVSPWQNGATTGTVYAFDAATGAQRWSHQLPTASDSNGYLPIIVG